MKRLCVSACKERHRQWPWSGLVSATVSLFVGFWLVWAIVMARTPDQAIKTPQWIDKQMEEGTTQVYRRSPYPTSVPGAVLLPPPPEPLSSKPAETDTIKLPSFVPMKSTPAESESMELGAVTPLRPAATESRALPRRPPKRAKDLAKETEVRAGHPDTPPAGIIKRAEAAGRVLLRILEQGDGPMIEIAWPADVGIRRALYRRFVNCYGMRVALLDSRDGRLFLDEGARGRPWEVNLDRYSGYIRKPSGRFLAEEREQVARIHDHHQILLVGAPVRLFPRRVDAFLLGGLRQMVGPRYGQANAIRATYLLEGGRVLVEGVSVDGRVFTGTLDLSPVAGRCRGDGT